MLAQVLSVLTLLGASRASTETQTCVSVSDGGSQSVADVNGPWREEVKGRGCVAFEQQRRNRLGPCFPHTTRLNPCTACHISNDKHLAVENHSPSTTNRLFVVSSGGQLTRAWPFFDPFSAEWANEQPANAPPKVCVACRLPIHPAGTSEIRSLPEKSHLDLSMMA